VVTPATPTRRRPTWRGRWRMVASGFKIVALWCVNEIDTKALSAKIGRPALERINKEAIDRLPPRVSSSSSRKSSADPTPSPAFRPGATDRAPRLFLCSHAETRPILLGPLYRTPVGVAVGRS